MSSIRRLLPWLAFVIFLLVGWRTYDLWNNIPGYGDALEVTWGIGWYHAAIFETGQSPFFDPFVFHPNGFHTVQVAHTPLLFLIGSLLVAGGASIAFAYNLIVLSSLALAFAGTKRFFIGFSGVFAATCAALVFTFADMRWTRIGGHVNVLIVTSLMPWFLYELVQINRTPWTAGRFQRPITSDTPLATGGAQQIRSLLCCVFLWALMIHFSFYSLFWGACCFAIWGKDLVRMRNLRWLLLITAGALLLASPLVWLYLIGRNADQPITPSVMHLASWSASLDTLFLPSLMHPWSLIREWGLRLFTGSQDESTIMNIGPITWGLGLIGIWQVWRSRSQYTLTTRDQAFEEKTHSSQLGLFWLTCVSTLLALGLVLRWNGTIVESHLTVPLNHAIWQIGHWFKPALFDASNPPSALALALPLPAYLLTAVLPFFESARVIARFALLSLFALSGLAALALDRFSYPWRWLLASVWLVSMLPTSSNNLPLPTSAHPAHQWVAQQPRQPEQGIIDVTPNISQMNDGTLVYATLLHHLPTASGVGAFAPIHFHNLQKWLASDPTNLSKPEAAFLFSHYGIRYVLLHLKRGEDRPVWEQLASNQALKTGDCFEPPSGLSPWDYPICVAEVLPLPDSAHFNLLAQEGWSGSEAWGRWVESDVATAAWVVTRQTEQRLQITAFPHCLPDSPQSVLIQVNRQPLLEHKWIACEEWQETVTIPAKSVEVGWNRIELKFVYAVRPVERPDSQSTDTRRLAAGFSQLRIDSP